MTATRQPRHHPLSRWAMTAPSRAIRTLGYLNEELLGAGEVPGLSARHRFINSDTPHPGCAAPPMR